MRDMVITAASSIGAAGCWDNVSGFRPWGDKNPIVEAEWPEFFRNECRRFSRMDLLSRVAVLAAESIIESPAMQALPERERAGVCLGTPSGSLGADLAYLKSMPGPGGPSPMLFAYTLPSSALGEICIRHRLRGPCLCALCSETESGMLLDDAEMKITRGEADACLCVYCEALDSDAAAAAGAPGGAAVMRAAAALAQSSDTAVAGPVMEIATGLFGCLLARCGAGD